jgi:hypothetical protein
VGPVFGVGACVGEDDRDAGVADLESGELVCEPVAVDVLELEQGAVAGLDDDRGEREFGEPLELEGEGAVGERRGEVVEALALNGGEQPPISGVDGVIAGGDGRAHGAGALVGETVGIALAGIDRDRDRLGEGAPARDAAAGVGGRGGLLRLPEDRLPPFDLGEDELRACLPGPVEDEIDRRPTTAADEGERLVDDLCMFGPWFFEAVAVDARGRRPGRPRLQHQAVSERQPHEVGQPAIGLRVPRDQKRRQLACRVTAHAAAAWYSWISPPSTSRRSTVGGGEPRASGC